MQPRRASEARRTAEPGQEQRLDQQRPADARAVAAERLADRELRRARESPHEQQVREVAAREQQHDARDDEQADATRHQRRVDLRVHADLVVSEQRDVSTSVEIRELLAVPRGQALQLAACLLDADVGC